jgi:hypothetical protein
LRNRPKTLALLISLIGVGIAPAVHANAALAPPALTALDVVRWTPGLQWPHGDVVEAFSAEVSAYDESRPAVDEDAPAPVRATDFSADLAPVEEVAALALAARDEHGADAIDETRAHDDTPPRSRLARLAQSVRAKLGAARGAAVAAPAASPPPASAAMRAESACATPPQAVEPDSAHDAWLLQCLAQAVPEGLELAASAPARLAARIAERFPAARAAPVDRQAGVALTESSRRASAALAAQRRDIVVVASQADKVRHQLAALLGVSRGALRSAASVPSEDRIVTTQSDKVLANLAQVTGALGAVEAQTMVVRSSEEIPASGTADVLDIDLSVAELPQIAPLPAPRGESSALGGRTLALTDASLDRVRGGFVTQGLNVSFGIERAVYVNGTLVTSTRLSVSEPGLVGSGHGAAPLDAATLAVVQNGSGNVVATGTLSASGIGTVVQNTLDGQNIRNLTVINATVNSLGVLRGLNLQSSLRGAVIDSLRR